jgi:hypothetical protein
MEQIEILKDEIWVLKRNTQNNWMEFNNIQSHLTRANGEATKTVFCVPLDSLTGEYKDIFSGEGEDSEEREILRETLANHLKLNIEDLYPGSEWLKAKNVNLIGKQREFNLALAHDYIDYLIVKSNKSVNVGEGFRANSEYTFTCENERVAKSVKRREIIADAYILLKNLNREEKESLLIAFGYNTSGMSQTGVEDAIGKEVESDPSRIIKFYNLPTFKAQVFVRKALQCKILTWVGTSVFYNENIIGINVEDAATWMLDPKNKSALEAIKIVMQERKVL